MRGWKKIFCANGNDKKAGIVILISDKIDFKTKPIKTRKYTNIIKGSIQEQDITLINIYTSNIGAPKYIKPIKGEIDRNTILVGDFNTPLTSLDRSSKQKINNAREILNGTIVQLGLINMYVTLHPKKNPKKQNQNTHSYRMHMEHYLG